MLPSTREAMGIMCHSFWEQHQPFRDSGPLWAAGITWQCIDIWRGSSLQVSMLIFQEEFMQGVSRNAD